MRALPLPLYGFFDPRRVYGRRPEFSLAPCPRGCRGCCSTRSSGSSSTRPSSRCAVPGLVAALAPRSRVGRSRPPRSSSSSLSPPAPGTCGAAASTLPARFLVPVVPALALCVAAALAGGLRRGSGAPRGLERLWPVSAGACRAAARPPRPRRHRAALPRRSGAEEWTRLLPGYVLADGAGPHRLALVWRWRSSSPLPWRRGPPTAPRDSAAGRAGPPGRGGHRLDGVGPHDRVAATPCASWAAGAGRAGLVLDREHATRSGARPTWGGGRSTSPTAIPRARAGRAPAAPAGRVPARARGRSLAAGRPPRARALARLGLEPRARRVTLVEDGSRLVRPLRVAPDETAVTLEPRGGGPCPQGVAARASTLSAGHRSKD